MEVGRFFQTKYLLFSYKISKLSFGIFLEYLKYNCYIICMRFKYDKGKDTSLKKKRGVGFEEVKELFYGPYYLDQIQDDPEQWVAIGWANASLYSVIYEEREDEEGSYYHLITLWKSTRAEREKYEEHS